MKGDHQKDHTFTCMRCGEDYPVGMMDYEEEDVCVYCVEDDERTSFNVDY